MRGYRHDRAKRKAAMLRMNQEIRDRFVPKPAPVFIRMPVQEAEATGDGVVLLPKPEPQLNQDPDPVALVLGIAKLFGASIDTVSFPGATGEHAHVVEQWSDVEPPRRLS